MITRNALSWWSFLATGSQRHFALYSLEGRKDDNQKYSYFLLCHEVRRMVLLQAVVVWPNFLLDCDCGRADVAAAVLFSLKRGFVALTHTPFHTPLTHTPFLQSWWRLMQHLSTAYRLLKLRQRSTRNSGGWQGFSVSVRRKKKLIVPPEFAESNYTFLFHLQIAFVREAKLKNCFIFIWKFAGRFLVIWQEKKEKKKQTKNCSLRKKLYDSKVNLLKQLFFSRLNLCFQGSQINRKQPPVLHHNVLVTS